MSTPCETYITRQYKRILRHYLNGDRTYYEIDDSIAELLPFAQTTKMPQLLKDYVLGISQTLKYARTNSVYHKIVCSLLFASGQISHYR